MRSAHSLTWILCVPIGAWLILGSAGGTSWTCETARQPSLEALTWFLRTQCYRELGWIHDAAVRQTGPAIDGVQYGVHGNAKVYYSPEAATWLRRGRPANAPLPDGTLLVKEQYGGASAQEPGALEGWTFMLKNRGQSLDGWYWGYVDRKDDAWNVAEYFLPSCINCHAGADNDELTFATLANTKPGHVTYANVETGAERRSAPALKHPHRRFAALHTLPKPRALPDSAFVSLFDEIDAQKPSDIIRFPNVANDHVVPKPSGPQTLLTSDVCSACHDANSTQRGKLPEMMLLDPAAGHVNLSPYGEWGASVMGLSGRDPIFHAQLESEKALHPELAGTLDDLCYRCHGVMGQRQLHLDRPGELFSHAMIYATGDHPDARYGALARDGVSCTACHRMSEEELGEAATFTGQFRLGPDHTVYGPFKDPKTYAMRQATGITPAEGPWIRESKMCGTCHTVILPVLDVAETYTPASLREARTTHEQTTYLEWLNSSYADAGDPSPPSSAKRCQDCHMPQNYPSAEDGLRFRVANVQDTRHPYVEHLADASLVDLPVREAYSRHTLLGINLFVMEMFQQFPEILGLHPEDPNIASTERAAQSLLLAEEHARVLATEETATLSIDGISERDGVLEVRVTVTNLAGHKLPSGVGFRRVFLELSVLGDKGQRLWTSGATNSMGVIVDAEGRPLATEFSATQVQPHHTIITRQDQVQIYESRHVASDGKLTTSFLGLAEEIKDNRLLPKGWQLNGPYAEVVAPVAVANDPDYRSDAGKDEVLYRVPLEAIADFTSVEASLHYQAIPPYYLRDRFSIAKGPETRRLHYLASHLDLAETSIEGWKLTVARATDRRAAPRR